MSFTPATLSPVPKHKKADDFAYSFQFVEDSSPLDLSTKDDVIVELSTNSATIFSQSSNDGENTISSSSGSNNDIISGTVAGETMDVATTEKGKVNYFLEVYTMLDGKKTTYVSSVFNIIGKGNSGTAHEWEITITNSTDSATGERATNVLALAVAAKDAAEAAAAKLPTISSGDAGKIPEVNSGETAFELIWQDFEGYNIKNYGADGGADDTTAIQNAINAANTAGGGNTIIPPGTWNVSGIQLKSNVNLIFAPGAIFFLIANSDSPTIFGNGVENSEILYPTIDGNKANQGNPPAGEYWDCISIRGSNGDATGTRSKNVKVYNADITNSPAMGTRFIGAEDSAIVLSKVRLSADDNVAVEDNTNNIKVVLNDLKDSTATGLTGVGSCVELEGGAENVTIALNDMDGGVIGVTLDIDSGDDAIKYVRISQNTFTGFTEEGILLNGDTNKCEHVDIIDNVFNGTVGAAIQLQDAHHVSISGGEMINCGTGISTTDGIITFVTGLDDISVSGVRIDGSPARGIYLKSGSGTNFSIKKNMLTNITANAIRCEVDNASINDNDIYDNPGIGIVLIGDNNQCNDNKISDDNSAGATYGITGGGNDNVLNGNHITGMGTDKYQLTGVRNIINGLATDSGSAETPTASNYEVGEMVSWTDTGDGSGDGVYLLLPDESTWTKLS